MVRHASLMPFLIFEILFHILFSRLIINLTSMLKHPDSWLRILQQSSSTRSYHWYPYNLCAHVTIIFWTYEADLLVPLASLNGPKIDQKPSPIKSNQVKFVESQTMWVTKGPPPPNRASVAFSLAFGQGCLNSWQNKKVKKLLLIVGASLELILYSPGPFFQGCMLGRCQCLTVVGLRNHRREKSVHGGASSSLPLRLEAAMGWDHPWASFVLKRGHPRFIFSQDDWGNMLPPW